MSAPQLLDYGSRDAWIAGRNSGVGASESSALFGLSPWESLYSLWARKTGRLPPEEIAGEWIEWGTLLEEPIAKRYEAKTGRKVWQGGPYCVAQHPEIECMRATPDRFVLEAPDRPDDGILQIKNTNAFMGHDWNDGVPMHVQVQVQHEMACTGRAWASVAVLIGGAEFRYFDVERNPDFIAELERQCVDFWGYVQRDEAPAIDGSTRTLETIKKLNPLDTGETVRLPGESTEWFDALESAKAATKIAEAAKTEAESRLRAAIGPATFGILPDGRTLSLKTTSVAGRVQEVQPYSFRTLRSVKKGSR